MIEPQSTETELRIFLHRWEAARYAQLAKWRLQLAYWQHKPGCEIVVANCHHKLKYYQHELAMLKELRARSLP